jgi:hypothetical protein
MGKILKTKIREHSCKEDHKIQCNKAETINKEENSNIKKQEELVFIRTGLWESFQHCMAAGRNV